MRLRPRLALSGLLAVLLYGCDHAPLPTTSGDAAASDAEHADSMMATADANVERAASDLGSWDVASGDVASGDAARGDVASWDVASGDVAKVDAAPADIAQDEGSVEGPRLQVLPAEVAFGEVLIGVTSDPVVLVLKNVGGATSAIVMGTVSDRTFRVVASGCAHALTPRESCTVTVVFEPDSAGPKVARLLLEGAGVSAAASLTGTGVRPPTLELSPVSQNFGDVPVGGESAPIEFTVRNAGDREAPRPSVFPTDGFALVLNGCATVRSLPPGGACKVSVVFSPSAVGTRSGTLTAIVPTSQAVAVLAGRGVQSAGVLFAPSAVDFEGITLGARAPAAR
jgi:hypothetical protein